MHAFEPNPKIASLLRRSANLNGFRNLHVHEVALGSQDEEVTLFVPNENTGAASTQADCAGRGRGEHLLVKKLKTSRYLESLHLGRVKAIKIDVEGAEAEILCGAEPVLSAMRPDFIVFESHDKQIAFFERPVVRAIATMTPHFFQVVVTRRWGMRPKLKAILCDDDVDSGYDFVAFRSPPSSLTDRNREVQETTSG